MEASPLSPTHLVHSQLLPLKATPLHPRHLYPIRHVSVQSVGRFRSPCGLASYRVIVAVSVPHKVFTPCLQSLLSYLVELLLHLSARVVAVLEVKDIVAHTCVAAPAPVLLLLCFNSLLLLLCRVVHVFPTGTVSVVHVESANRCLMLKDMLTFWHPICHFVAFSPQTSTACR